MFFRSFLHPRRYARRGFRLRSNTLIWLFVFFLIGLFLHYGGRTEPVVAFWNDVKSLVGIKSSPKQSADNPYKAPEPTPEVASDNTDTEASDDRSLLEKNRTSSRKNRSSSAMAIADRKLFDFEKAVDFALPAFGSNDAVIRHDGYTLRYREEYEQADWVAYPLLENEIFGDAERKNEQFQPDPDVKTGSALASDYTRSGYDRGHLAPAGDFKFSQNMMRQTFYMSNISPQQPDFNRGIWRELEEQVRAWAVRDKGLYIVTGPVLRPGLPTIGRKNQVAVPEYYYKVILYCNNPDIRMIAFLMKNEGSDRSLKQFVVPVDEVERQTGIDFFPKIPDKLEQQLESARPARMIADWFSF
ncbi:DNA/RNA non-specific endonuclease [Larkinella sp. VNQ87]|uniref:DNA/RNA non-specific endonuclease n=1 Tax=Larkinella sp. VNQ87 TaxID=3400921 RepID=UPI003C0F8256